MLSKIKSIYFLIPIFEHGKTIKIETESREVRENRIRESDGRNSIELRTMIKVDQQ